VRRCACCALWWVGGHGNGWAGRGHAIGYQPPATLGREHEAHKPRSRQLGGAILQSLLIILLYCSLA
jgi:hypothetical protein